MIWKVGHPIVFPITSSVGMGPIDMADVRLPDLCT